MGKLAHVHTDLNVYQNAFKLAMNIFDLSKDFPKEETYALTDQIRRSSRSICVNIAEAWRARWYEKMFISKLALAESEAAETQVWIEFAVKCGYLDREISVTLYRACDEIIGSIVGMIRHSTSWTIKP